jgi:hypothetical protein
MNHYEKKESKEIKTNINCFFCYRQLTATELFYSENTCFICRLKKGSNLQPIDINSKNTEDKKE